MDDSERILVVLLTMHRSGSSVSTSILERLGMSLGPFELLGPDAHNRHGHFEAIEIFELNQKVQTCYHGFADDLPLTEECFESFTDRSALWALDADVPEVLFDQARSLVTRLIESGRVSGFKDPRTVLVWPFWERVFLSFPGLRVVPLALVRSPHEIAMSLCTRSDGFYLYTDCLDMVAVHFDYLAKIRERMGGRLPVVRFGTPWFLDDLAGAVAECGLTWDREKADQSLDRSCVHQLPAVVTHRAQELYDTLCPESMTIDPIENQARLNADARSCGRMVRQRLARSDDEVKMSRELLSRAEVSLKAAGHQLSGTHEQLRSALDLRFAADAHFQSCRAQLREAQVVVEQTQAEFKACERYLSETQEELRKTQEVVRQFQDELAIAADVNRRTANQLALCQETVRELTARHHEQKATLDQIESDPILGFLIRGRHHLRKAIGVFRWKSAL